MEKKRLFVDFLSAILPLTSFNGRTVINFVFRTVYWQNFVASNIHIFLFRYTKPLTFADCISDELPLGWEEAYDTQVGVYYIDHNTSKCDVIISKSF